MTAFGPMLISSNAAIWESKSDEWVLVGASGSRGCYSILENLGVDRVYIMIRKIRIYRLKSNSKIFRKSEKMLII